MTDAASDAGEPHITSPEEFKYAVREFIRIHDELATIRKSVSEMNKKKKKFSELIVAFMKQNDKEFCNLGTEGTLAMKTSKTTLALKKEQVMLLLKQYGNDEKTAQETAEFLWSNKETRFKSVIKRSNVPL